MTSPNTPSILCLIPGASGATKPAEAIGKNGAELEAERIAAEMAAEKEQVRVPAASANWQEYHKGIPAGR